jgi:hypothetical protein
MIEHFKDDFSYGGYANAAERLTERIIGLEAALALCVQALETVGWIPSDDCGWVYCWWCKEEWHCNKPSHWKHKADCIHEHALAAAKEYNDCHH